MVASKVQTAGRVGVLCSRKSGSMAGLAAGPPGSMSGLSLHTGTYIISLCLFVYIFEVEIVIAT